MASRVIVALAGGLLTLFALLLAVQNDVSADQRLQNGSFEAGLANWAGVGLSASGCTPHGGAAALSLSTSASSPSVLAQQTVAGPFGAGSHTLSGFYKVGSGTPSITVAFIWRTSTGDQPPRSQTLAANPAYTAFSLNDNNPPANATSLVVKLTAASSASAMVCFDDLGLEAPPPPPPTPIPTMTPTATQIPTTTATATPVPTSTSVAPTPTSTIPAANPSLPPPTATTATGDTIATPTATTISAPTATRTSTPDPAQTSTPTTIPGGTATPSASGTATTTATSGLQFVNGGFEQGTTGWQRYGGDLQGVSNPTHSGSGAAMLSSNTTSTKWAYQVVAIDPSKAYEFNGYLRPSSGVKSSYLRISWYEAADGGGSAISTDDSASKLAGPNDAYVFVTTGGIAPPAAAHSARLRIMLAPDSASTATVHLDDFSFFLTTASPRPASKTSAPDEPIETPVPAATSRPADATSTAAAQATSALAAGTPAVASTPETPKEATAAARAAKTSTAVTAKSNAAKTTATPKNALTAEVAGSRSDKTPEAGIDGAEPTALSPLPDHQSKTAVVFAALLAVAIAVVGTHYMSNRRT